jgi:hypothetical protein
MKSTLSEFGILTTVGEYIYNSDDMKESNNKSRFEIEVQEGIWHLPPQC